MMKSAVARKLQGRLDFQGLSVSIENRKGGVREGVDSDGAEWRTKMKHPYGYIKGTIGADGEHVDCFIGPDDKATKAYVIHIKDPKSGRYDEDKVMLGFGTKEQAEKSFRCHYDNPGRYLLGISVITIEALKKRFELDKKKGRSTRMLKTTFIDGFVETLHKEAGAGTMAASMLIPTSVLATTGATIGALSNKDNRGKGALIGAGIGGGMGVVGGYPIGRALNKVIAGGGGGLGTAINRHAKDFAKNMNTEELGSVTNKAMKGFMNKADLGEEVTRRFGEATEKMVRNTRKGVTKGLNPFSRWRKKGT